MNNPSITREARIIYPMINANSLEEQPETFRSVVRTISSLFGGYTVFDGQGGWTDGNQHLVSEAVKIIDIAAHDNAQSRAWLTSIAKTIKIEMAQECVYVRFPDGSVEFI